MKKVTVVVPAHNEEGNILPLHQEIQRVFAALPAYTFELIFVNDGSRDATQQVLEELALTDARVRYLEFSRNFGHQAAVKAGMDAATGEVVISMDGDFQHPPSLIPELLQHWENGADIVNTRRTYASTETAFKRKTSSLFYRLLSYLSDLDLKDGGASDFRLVDQSVVEVFRNLPEQDLFLRGLTSWMGFRQETVAFTAGTRHSGTSSYNLQKMVRFAFSGITAFSVKPLYISAYAGIIFSVVAVLGYSVYVLQSFIFKTEISGWASLIMTVVFFGGLQLLMFGIMGLYLGKIFKQTKQRPSYIIRSKNF